MADPLSTSASIIAIIQLSSEVIKYVSGVTGATKERKHLRDEVRACEFILQQLKDEVDDAEEGNEWPKTIKTLEGPDAPPGRLWVALSLVKVKLEFLNYGKPVYYLIVDIEVVPLSIKCLDLHGFEFRVTFIEGLWPLLSERLGTIVISTRDLENRSTLAYDNECQGPYEFNKQWISILGRSKDIINQCFLLLIGEILLLDTFLLV